jgi:peptidoglycan/xylan/chitin deacetylase (PgdA/CDA1 family)
VDCRDWAGGTAELLTRRLVRGTLAHGDGAVVLTHGWPTATPAALHETIAQLRDAGADFVTIDALPHVPGRRSDLPVAVR